MDMLINPAVVITAQSINMSNHHIIHFNIYFFLVNYVPGRGVGGEREQSLSQFRDSSTLMQI